MAYAVIELLTLNFALNPPFRQTLVICRLLFLSALIVDFVERESSFGFGRMEKPNVLEHTWLIFS